jgi:hypothetical protein
MECILVLQEVHDARDKDNSEVVRHIFCIGLFRFRNYIEVVFI